MRAHTHFLTRIAIFPIAAGLLYGCSGGGCGGMEPIPEGFPLDRRVENGIQMRLTSSGIDFVEENIEPILGSLVGGSLAFPVPPMTQPIEVLGIGLSEARICHSGQCNFCMEITGIDLTPTPPNQLNVRLDIIAWTGDASCGSRPLDIVAPFLLWDITCGADVDTRSTGSPDMPIVGTIDFVIDRTTGYTSVNFAEMDATSGFESDDISLGGDFVCDIADWLVGFFVDSLIGGINDQLAGAMSDFTCASCAAGEACPTGSVCSSGTCVKPDGSCAAPLLGLEGRLDLGALMAGVSPGLNAQVDMLMAAGHTALANDGGLSLGIYGGMEPVTTSHCVPRAEPPSQGPVAFSEVINNSNDCATCEPPEAHAIVGVSETFLNRAGWGFQQSGGLCLGIGGGTLPVTSGALVMLMPSLRSVTWGVESPLAIDLRPGQPPTFELGTSSEDEPLMAITMREVAIDFYIWGHDRYTRFLTAAMDLTVNLDLTAEAGELRVAVRGLSTENLTIENSELLSENPATLAAAFAALIDTMLGPMLGDLGSFPLPPMAGFSLNVPTGGLGHLEDGGEEFLMLYATLGIADAPTDPPAPRPMMQTIVDIEELRVPPTEAFNGNLSPAQIPSLTLNLDAEVADDEVFEAYDDLEFRYRVDSGFWSPWSVERQAVIEHGMFLFQGRHQVEVQARIAGLSETADPEPAQIEVIIDTVAPELTLLPVTDERIEIEVDDMVSPVEAIQLEWRALPEGSWQAVEEGGIDVPDEAEEVEVRATDEAGNVSVSRQAIRGRLPTDGSSGCGGCATTSREGGRAPFALLLIALAGALLWRRRRISPFGVILLAAAGMTACSEPIGPNPSACDGPDAPEGCCVSDEDCDNGLCCPNSNLCIEWVDTCAAPSVCSEMPGLNDDCNFLPCGSCEMPAPLRMGLIGLHSSVAVAPDGSAWVAGYAAGTAYNRTYGDLALAHVNASADRVPDEAWEAIDGVPADGEVRGDPTGWRNGIADSGDDVGRYASIATDGAGNFGVAYYDATNGSLKYLPGAGGSWGAPVVVEAGTTSSDSGRFADLVFLPSGAPAIAYMAIEDAGDHQITRARYIEARDAGGTGWGSPVDLDVMDPTPLPAEGVVPDLPEGTGVWPDLAIGPGGTRGVIFYNRTDGDLVGAAFDGASWGPAQILAGRDGDMGWAPSLAVDDAGVWHASFVDGVAEDLIYLTSNGTREVIDGRSLGEHWNLRGDDSSIVVLPSGEVRVAYQDATDHVLWLAVRDPSGLWTTEQLSGAGLEASATEGFYVHQTQNGNSSVISAWFYDAQTDENGLLLFWR